MKMNTNVTWKSKLNYQEPSRFYRVMSVRQITTVLKELLYHLFHSIRRRIIILYSYLNAILGNL